MNRPTVAVVDLGALRRNYRLIRSMTPPACGILAVVKADAYGHGFMDVARELESMDVTAFGVAFLAEGIQLRKSGIDRPILILGGIYPGQERKCVGYNLSTAIFSEEQARLLDAAAKSLYRKARVHVKIDTGMGRLGIPHDDAPRFFQLLSRHPHLELEGVMTHLSVADELGPEGSAHTEEQLRRFQIGVDAARSAGFSPRFVHLSNSAATVSALCTECTLVRPGIALYGVLPSPDFAGRLTLSPVMSFRSRVAMVKSVPEGTPISYGRRYVTGRPSVIASIPAGYADGYPRSLSNRGEVLIRGGRAPVAGTVCMDWLMADVTDIPGVTPGDEVILFGADADGNRIAVEEVAAWGGTIPYEILCGVSKRVPRIYLPAGREEG